MSQVEPIAEYDANGRIIHYRNSNGYERWWEYDSKSNLIHFWDTCGNDNWYWRGERTQDPIKILLLKAKLRDKSSAML